MHLNAAPTSLILIPGGPGMDSGYFRPFLNALAGPASLVPLDPGVDGQLNIIGLVEQVRNAVQQETARGQDVFLLGHSFGGALALEYVKSHGESDLKGLALVSWVHSAGFLAEFMANNPSYSEPVVDASLPPNERMRAAVLADAELYFPPAVITKGRDVLAGIRYNKSLSEAIFGEYLGDFELAETLAGLSLPVLSVTGGADRVVSTSHVATGVARLKNIRGAHVLGGAGHFPFVDAPEVFNSLVKEFIKSTHS